MHVRKVVGLVVIVGIAALEACTSSSESAGPTDTRDGSAPSSEASVAPDGASPNDASSSCSAFTGNAPASADAECHDLVNSAALVTAVADPGTMPTGTGGTVADGLYHLTELKTYPGSPLAGFKIKLTVLIKDGVSYQVTDVDGNPKSLRKTEQDNPDGGHGILACSNHGPGSLTVSSYTATCNEIMTYDATEKFSTKLVRQ